MIVVQYPVYHIGVGTAQQGCAKAIVAIPKHPVPATALHAGAKLLHVMMGPVGVGGIDLKDVIILRLSKSNKDFGD